MYNFLKYLYYYYFIIITTENGYKNLTYTLIEKKNEVLYNCIALLTILTI